jgi:hypothetical protein
MQSLMRFQNWLDLQSPDWGESYSLPIVLAFSALNLFYSLGFVVFILVNSIEMISE